MAYYNTLVVTDYLNPSHIYPDRSARIDIPPGNDSAEVQTAAILPNPNYTFRAWLDENPDIKREVDGANSCVVCGAEMPEEE